MGAGRRRSCGNGGTSGTGANGVFAYGNGSSVTLSNVTIEATADGGHGVMASGGGALTLTDVNINTAGASSAAIPTDRGGGTINVTGGTMVTSGANSPGIYPTGDITVAGAPISAIGAESAVIEGANSITLTDVAMTSSMTDKWGVRIHQSTSGDASGARGVFTMTGGSLANTATIEPLFFVTNTTAAITLKDVDLTAGSGTLLEAGGTSRWGTAGANGGTVELTADGETLTGDMVTEDTISSISAGLTNGTVLTGSVYSATLTIDSTSTWNLTAASTLAGLTTAGTIAGTATITASAVSLQSGIVSAPLAGTGTLTKSTSGTAILAGANTYTGATTVTGGTLDLTGSLASPGVTVAAGAARGGTGTIAGVLSLASGATLVLGPSGHLSVGGNVTFGGTVTVAPASTRLGGTATLSTYGGALQGSSNFVYAGPSGQTATFSTSMSGAITVTLSSSAFTITSTSPLPDGQVGVSYSQTLAASGGAGGYAWSVVGGSLPGGLSLSSAGTITGTPTATGDYGFTIRVTDSASATAEGVLPCTLMRALRLRSRSSRKVRASRADRPSLSP